MNVKMIVRGYIFNYVGNIYMNQCCAIRELESFSWETCYVSFPTVFKHDKPRTTCSFGFMSNIESFGKSLGVIKVTIHKSSDTQ